MYYNQKNMVVNHGKNKLNMFCHTNHSLAMVFVVKLWI